MLGALALTRTDSGAGCRTLAITSAPQRLQPAPGRARRFGWDGATAIRQTVSSSPRAEAAHRAARRAEPELGHRRFKDALDEVQLLPGRADRLPVRADIRAARGVHHASRGLSLIH